MKYLKSSLPRGSLLHTTILLIYISFIEIGFYFDEICIPQFQYHPSF